MIHNKTIKHKNEHRITFSHFKLEKDFLTINNSLFDYEIINENPVYGILLK